MQASKVLLVPTVALIMAVGAAGEGASQPDSENPAPIVRKSSVEEYAAAAQGNFTGLIVDCRGLGLRTVMSPVISNSNGTKIYGHKNLDIEKINAIGMVDYAKNLREVTRAGSNPLVVKAISLNNFNSDPVVSLVDSNRILIENYASKFLQNLKVVFLFD